MEAYRRKIMKIIFAEQFAENIGCTQSELAIQKPITVRELLELMAGQYTYFQQHRSEFVESYPSFGVLLINHRNIARLDDIISNGDTIEVIPPLMGG